MFPNTFGSEELDGVAPSSRVLNRLPAKRADEGVPPKGSGWRGHAELMDVGVGYISRELCDGQTLASPGRWPVAPRRYPDTALWRSLAAKFMEYSRKYGTTEQLMKLALGGVDSCPFEAESIQALKSETPDILTEHGWKLERDSGDRTHILIDFRYMNSLLRASRGPGGGNMRFRLRVRVGPGVRLPRIPALYPHKKKWRLQKQIDPLDYLEEQSGNDAVWRQNYLEEHTDKVLEVMVDQASRGQVLQLSEEEARKRFPNLTAALLGAQRKEKPGGVITARVLFDGTLGIAVNHRTRTRDQERAPIAADQKRIMREKSKTEEPTFALSADATEGHRQVPISRQDWHLLGCQVRPGGDVFVNTVGTFGVASASYCWSSVDSAIGQCIPGSPAGTWPFIGCRRLSP